MLNNNEKIMAEKEFQNKIKNNISIQKSIFEILNLSNNCVLINEVEFINGITSDFIICDNDIIKAIIECKRADIGATEYVRGVGQLYQYEYFQDENITPKKYKNLTYNKNINNNILIIPSDFIKNTNLNIGKFRYPNNSMIFEVHTKNNIVRRITDDELEKLKKIENNNLVTISQYYIRDNRIFECYILFQLLGILNRLNIKLNRNDIENKILRKVNVINNKNWRNAFITLSSLGFIGVSNKIQNKEMNFLNYNIFEFIDMIYKDYLYPFVDLIMDILLNQADKNGIIDINNQELSLFIRSNFKGKDILFLTESNGRYISSWLNILRDDIGCIDFEKRNSIRKINFIPKELNEIERVEKIKKFSKCNKYIDDFYKIQSSIIKEVL